MSIKTLRTANLKHFGIDETSGALNVFYELIKRF